MQPPFPLIGIANNFVELVTDKSGLDPSTVLDLLWRLANNTAYFDRFGGVWNAAFSSDDFRNNALTRFLARTIYNPTVRVRYDWKRMRDYDIGELQAQLSDCIDQDDDILTQFVAGDILKLKLAAAKNFEAVVDVLSRYVFRPDEDKIAREFPAET